MGDTLIIRLNILPQEELVMMGQKLDINILLQQGICQTPDAVVKSSRLLLFDPERSEILIYKNYDLIRQLRSNVSIRRIFFEAP